MTPSAILTEWVEGMIIDNPELYAGDFGGHNLAAEYIKINMTNGAISPMVVAGVPSVYRSRRKFLEDHPEYDRRDIALRFRKKPLDSSEHEGQTFIDFDTLTDDEAKELIGELIEHVSGGTS